MSGGYNLPWFPAWGIEFDTPIGNLQKIIYKFNKIRPNNRWLLVRFDSVASEFHLWSTWISVVTKEINDAMIAKSVDVEFQRLLSGNRQISKAFEIVGLSKEDSCAWIISIPKIIEQLILELSVISRNSYSYLDYFSTELIRRLGAKLLPKRPMPSINGLNKMGIETKNRDFSSKEKEELLIGAMVLTDI